jgi:hypothetical protein
MDLFRDATMCFSLFVFSFPFTIVPGLLFSIPLILFQLINRKKWFWLRRFLIILTVLFSFGMGVYRAAELLTEFDVAMTLEPHEGEIIDPDIYTEFRDQIYIHPFFSRKCYVREEICDKLENTPRYFTFIESLELIITTIFVGFTSSGLNYFISYMCRQIRDGIKKPLNNEMIGIT